MKKNNIGSFLLITLIYVCSALIALFTNVSIKDVMNNYQYNVLIILIVMELFTNLISSTGIMEMLSIKLAILSKGNKKLILVLFGLLMFFISAFLNNITAVMMILPIIFVLLKTIGINKKYLNLLGLANVAKGIVSGETLIKSIAANETKLVVIANDASANTKKKITDKCHFYHVDYFIVDENIETISKAVGKNNRVALGITNQGFAKKIKELIGGWFYGKTI